MQFANLTAAQYVVLYNAITDGKPVRKFETRAVGVKRCYAEIVRLGISIDEAMAALDFVTVAPTLAPTVAPTKIVAARLAANGDTVFVPVAPTLAIAAPTVAPIGWQYIEGGLESTLALVAPTLAIAAPTVAPTVSADTDKPHALFYGRSDWTRTNKTVPAMLAAMRDGAKTLAELTAIGQWQAPVELRHIRKMGKMGNCTIDAIGEGANRKYFIAQ